MLRDMLLCRTFEERAAEEYTKGNIVGFLHLYPGEEAVAAGVLNACGPSDYIVSNYREHAHALERATPPGEVMAELFGRATGMSKGMGGSMHMFDRDTAVPALRLPRPQAASRGSREKHSLMQLSSKDCGFDMLLVISIQHAMSKGATITFDVSQHDAPPSCTGGSAIGLSTIGAWAEPLSVICEGYAQSPPLASLEGHANSKGPITSESARHAPRCWCDEPRL
jgi:Dehydrogenase E1 component